jgi:hypothetical protein
VSAAKIRTPSSDVYTNIPLNGRVDLRGILWQTDEKQAAVAARTITQADAKWPAKDIDNLWDIRFKSGN